MLRNPPEGILPHDLLCPFPVQTKSNDCHPTLDNLFPSIFQGYMSAVLVEGQPSLAAAQDIYAGKYNGTPSNARR
jgi:hypothetical protein